MWYTLRRPMICGGSQTGGAFAKTTTCGKTSFVHMCE